MNYSFKVTTCGRELLAALLAAGEELEITRAAVGSGRVDENMNLADMTDLVQYVAEAKISERRHQDNVLYLTVQYASNFTPGLGAFYLSEFIIQAKHPVSGEEVTVIYATLGDYIQPVNAYSETLPPDIREYPLQIAISDEINVTISAPAGLVTYSDLDAAVEKACKELVDSMATGGIKKTFSAVIPMAGWTEDPQSANGYGFYYDLQDPDITASMIPEIIIEEDSLETAYLAGMCQTATSYAGYIRMKCVERPAADIAVNCNLLVKGETSGITAVLPVASSDTLGGVKIPANSGLKVDNEGNLSVDVPTEEETSAAIEEVFGDGETDAGE